MSNRNLRSLRNHQRGENNTFNSSDISHELLDSLIFYHIGGAMYRSGALILHPGTSGAVSRHSTTPINPRSTSQPVAWCRKQFLQPNRNQHLLCLAPVARCSGRRFHKYHSGTSGEMSSNNIFSIPEIPTILNLALWRGVQHEDSSINLKYISFAIWHLWRDVQK